MCACQVELVRDLGLGAGVLLVGLARGAAVIGVDRVHDPHGDTQALHDRGTVGDLRGRERVRVAAADVAERYPTAIDKTQRVTDLAVTGEQLVEQDVRAGEQPEVLADEHLAPFRVGHSTVELPDIDGRVGTRAFAVVDGDPERGTGTELQVIDLLAHVEPQVIGQKAHLHPRLAAVELLTFTVDLAVDVERVDIAVGGKGGLVLVVQHDLGLRQGTQADSRKAGDGNCQVTRPQRLVFIVVHGALQTGDRGSEAIIERWVAVRNAALAQHRACLRRACKARWFGTTTG